MGTYTVGYKGATENRFSGLHVPIHVSMPLEEYLTKFPHDNRAVSYMLARYSEHMLDLSVLECSSQDIEG